MQHELGATVWTPDRELLAKIVEGVDMTNRALVFLGAGQDPGPSVEIIRPGHEPPEPEGTPRVAVRRPPSVAEQQGRTPEIGPHTATAADWESIGLPVRVVTEEDAEAEEA